MTQESARDLIARFRHIAEHIGGVQICKDGTRWHPSELVLLISLYEGLLIKENTNEQGP